MQPGPNASNRRFALLGGVFDPVHKAHTEVARRACHKLAVDTVAFLPAGDPPHKKSLGTAKPHHRQRMLELALDGIEWAVIDTRELHRPGPSYTVDTLREIHAESPGCHIYFLIGSDNIVHLHKWYRAEEFFELCTPVVVPRPRITGRFESEHVPWLNAQRIEELNEFVLPGAALEISSSDIRRRVANRESIAGLVRPAVARYIEDHQLYR